MIEFSDFQCPYCKRVEDSLKKVKAQTYGDKVRLVWKHRPLPFHPRAEPAAELRWRPGEGLRGQRRLLGPPADKLFEMQPARGRGSRGLRGLPSSASAKQGEAAIRTKYKKTLGGRRGSA